MGAVGAEVLAPKSGAGEEAEGRPGRAEMREEDLGRAVVEILDAGTLVGEVAAEEDGDDTMVEEGSRLIVVVIVASRVWPSWTTDGSPSKDSEPGPPRQEVTVDG